MQAFRLPSSVSSFSHIRYNKIEGYFTHRALINTLLLPALSLLIFFLLSLLFNACTHMHTHHVLET